MKKVLLVCTLALLAAAPALAIEKAWVGTWKLDPARSHFAGDTFTFSKAANGMMHYSDGSTTSYDFGIDGKPYKTHEDRVSVWTASGDNTWDEAVSAKGNQLVKVHYVLSADGKTLNMTYSGTKPDGTTFNDSAIYTRITGAKGLTGKWQSTKVTISAPDEFVVSEKEGGIVHWDIPGFKEAIEGKMDGSDLPITGPTVAPGMTVSLKSPSPKVIHYTVKASGKVLSNGTQTLAADGKSFVDVSWSPGKMSEKATGYYAKQ